MNIKNKETVSLEELAISNMYKIEAIIRVLEKNTRGVHTAL